MNKQQRRAQQRKILVVDDEPGVTRLLKINLEATERYRVRAENDSKLALDAALEFQPDLVLMDVMMPGLDGGDLAVLFKEHPRLRDTPVVFLTATARKDEVDEHGGTIGGMPMIAKPVDRDELVQRIEEQLAGRPSKI